MPVSKALAIRLALHGCTNRPFYHFVVMLKHKGRDKYPMEQLGTYDPMPNQQKEQLVAINFDRLKYWMAKGAEPSKPVQKLLGLSGFLPLHPMTFMEAKRNREQATEAAGSESVDDTEQAEVQTSS